MTCPGRTPAAPCGGSGSTPLDPAPPAERRHRITAGLKRLDDRAPILELAIRLRHVRSELQNSERSRLDAESKGGGSWALTLAMVMMPLPGDCDAIHGAVVDYARSARARPATITPAACRNLPLKQRLSSMLGEFRRIPSSTDQLVSSPSLGSRKFGTLLTRRRRSYRYRCRTIFPWSRTVMP